MGSFTKLGIKVMSASVYILYSRKYWGSLHLAILLQNDISNTIGGFKFGGIWYSITIHTYMLTEKQLAYSNLAVNQLYARSALRIARAMRVQSDRRLKDQCHNYCAIAVPTIP